MSVIIPADATDAFSHLFMVGLASILEDADAERVCAFRWKDTLQAFELKTNDGLGIDQMAEAVHAHAKRWSQSLPLTSENDFTRFQPPFWSTRIIRHKLVKKATCQNTFFVKPVN